MTPGPLKVLDLEGEGQDAREFPSNKPSCFCAEKDLCVPAFLVAESGKHVMMRVNKTNKTLHFRLHYIFKSALLSGCLKGVLESLGEGVVFGLLWLLSLLG